MQSCHSTVEAGLLPDDSIIDYKAQLELSPTLLDITWSYISLAAIALC